MQFLLFLLFNYFFILQLRYFFIIFKIHEIGFFYLFWSINCFNRTSCFEDLVTVLCTQCSSSVRLEPYLNFIILYCRILSWIKSSTVIHTGLIKLIFIISNLLLLILFSFKIFKIWVYNKIRLSKIVIWYCLAIIYLKSKNFRCSNCASVNPIFVQLILLKNMIKKYILT